ncbi:hypothetical protein ACC691_38940, partial [Rhizobium johnstonii]|uniref:hypothetical protein n=1 Tax=Rhizobium johnstonii TaxID=3019933 RepID=UPI003F9CD90C
AAAATPGEIQRWDGGVERLIGLAEPASERAKAARTLRYDDVDGNPQGFASFHIEEHPHVLEQELPQPAVGVVGRGAEMIEHESIGVEFVG